MAIINQTLWKFIMKVILTILSTVAQAEVLKLAYQVIGWDKSNISNATIMLKIFFPSKAQSYSIKPITAWDWGKLSMKSDNNTSK